ncbi:MAG: MotA/TolQ/ExbB proton channel family protein, partial [bacterium]|nr:MotA/TolQ/ExbB proton channel family protein [bacterium]
IICEQATSPLAKILKNTLEYPNLTRENMEITLEKNGQLQAQYLLRNLRFLGAIGSIAPMLGLLGTVIGMIKAFNVVAQGDPDLVSKAIAEALITTAAGLVIGILALISYYYFRGVAERISLEMETFIQNLFNTRIPTSES